MSQLQKTIAKLQRRDGPAIGFGPVSREQPKAMALIARVRSADEARAAIEAGADAVLFHFGDAATAAKALHGVAGPKVAAGVLLDALSEADAETLRAAGCDFVVSPLETTDSSAVDTEKMGHVVIASESLEDNILRSLGPLGLDGLYVERPHGAMKLAGQLGLVRIASFASTGIIATIDAGASVSDLRVLRDSGVVAVVAPASSSPTDIAEIVTRLKAVPPPRKSRREGAGDMALVPTLKVAPDEEEEHEHEEDE
jgi:hypothetical protein